MGLVYALAFSPDGSSFVVGGRGEKVQAWSKGAEDGFALSQLRNLLDLFHSPAAFATDPCSVSAVRAELRQREGGVNVLFRPRSRLKASCHTARRVSLVTRDSCASVGAHRHVCSPC